MNNNQYNIRRIEPEDYIYLEDFLYNALFVPEGEEPPDRYVILQPDIYVYIDGFGSKFGDIGVVSETDQKIIGMAWTRVIDEYDPEGKSPQLAISILKEYQGLGIGQTLMKHLFISLRRQGFTRTSLSVIKESRAVQFYQSLGYEIIKSTIDEERDDHLMEKKLEKTDNLFSGKAHIYHEARPRYPEEVLDFIVSYVPIEAVIAEIGAGTGILTLALAKRGYEVYAVEPNPDMYKVLLANVSLFPNVITIQSSAEDTSLEDHSVDLIISAHALHWFDPELFKRESLRIGKQETWIAAVYNNIQGK